MGFRQMIIPSELKIWILVTVVGVLVGSIASFIEICTLFLSDLKDGLCLQSSNYGWYLNRKFCCWETSYESCDSWKTYSQIILPSYASISTAEFINFVFYLSFSLLMASFAFLLTHCYSPFAASSGLPEIKTILGGHAFPAEFVSSFISPFTGLVKALGVTLSVASGLSIGKESTLVHISCCFVSFFKLSQDDFMDLLSVASAAGISVAFGAPIAGVLFSIEEVSSKFSLRSMWMSFYCCIVASAVMQSIDPFRTGKVVMYQTTYDRDWHVFELFFFVLLGCIGGLYGVLMVRASIWLTKLRNSHPFWTGEKLSFMDWFTWIIPLFEQFTERIYRWATYRTLDSPNAASENQLGSSNTNASESVKYWWDPPARIRVRYFQELMVLCILTACISYGHPYLRQDMTYFLSGLLQECPYDKLIKHPALLGADFNETMNLQANLLFKRDLQVPLNIGDAASASRGHGISGEDNDYFHLCDQSGSSLIPLLIFSALIRILLTAFTFGLRVPAGIYLPSMVIGACFGRALGLIVSAIVPSTYIITPGTYALVGAASALGGVTKLTVSIAVIMFEITGGGALSYIVPIMISLMSAKFVADALDRKNLGSLTEAFINFYHYPYLNMRKTFRFLREKEMESPGHKVSVDSSSMTDLIQRDTIYESVLVDDVLVPITAGQVIPLYQVVQGDYWKPYPHVVSEISEKLNANDASGFPIVETLDTMVLVGYIKSDDMKQAITKATKQYNIDQNAPCYFISNEDAEAYKQDESHFNENYLPNVHKQSYSFAGNSTEDSFNTSIKIDFKEGQYRVFINFSEWINYDYITVMPNYPMDLVVEMFKKMMLSSVFVVKEGSMSTELVSKYPAGSIIGILSKADVLNAVAKLQNEYTFKKRFSSYSTATERPDGSSLNPRKGWKGMFSNTAESSTEATTDVSTRAPRELGSRISPIILRGNQEYFVDSSGYPIR